MNKRRLGFVGCSPELHRVCMSMLGIVASRGDASWEVAPPEQADLVLWHPSVPRPEHHLVACLHTVPPSSPDEFGLCYPFRVMQLLQLLDDAAARLGHPLPGPVSPVLPPPAPCGALGSGDRGLAWLRDAWRSSGEGGWYRTMLPGGAVRVCLRQRAYWGPPAALERLRAQGLSGATFHPVAPLETQELGPPRRFEELVWWAGRRSTEPCLGLPIDAPQQLVHWPDFGYLRESTQDIVSCAHLAHRNLSASDLAGQTGRPVEEERRFLTACALVGCVRDAAEFTAVPSPPLALPKTGGWRGFIARLRAHLDIPTPA